VEFTAVSWNLFHGRDYPPDPSLFTWRSRLLGREERSATHVQVNRDLLAEFARVLAGARWDVALLQECPPRFAAPLARACGAEAHRVLTSRNSLGALRAALARRNPDLIASGEGGSNLTLVRASLHRNDGVLERQEVEIHSGRPERRAMALTRVATEAGDLCLANLHATHDRPTLATADVLGAAEAAVAWAGSRPLLFGGDLNLRPAEAPEAFERLCADLGLSGATEPGAIDHLLVRGLELVDPPAPWPAERRELVENGLRLRLSDHAPVEGRFKAGSPIAAKRQE
jgi:endonuclease/exonuclease/phosphatase family metal-dependent hydrolase